MRIISGTAKGKKIFTPIDKSVGSNEIGEHSQESTWLSSFKWKPPEFNTIDFLVSFKKGLDEADAIYYIHLKQNFHSL